jgi:DNA-binding Lrp family transcriptional regulator
MLNGSLDTVALPDVLRLIASSGKSGLLRIEEASPSGRIFIVDGLIAFATTRNENDPIDDLLHMEYRADYVGSSEDRRVVDLNDLLESNPEAFNRFLEQMVVEVMSRLLRVDDGRFRFDVDIRSHREIPHAFEVEDMISQASARSAAWARVFEVVPSASAPFRMAPRLHDAEQVALGRRDWALLAATGASTSIDEIAQKLKIFEFAAAKKVAELTQRGLIEFINTEISQNSLAANELLSGVVSAVVVEEEAVEPNTVENETVEEMVATDGRVEVELADLTSEEPPEAAEDAKDEPEAEPDGPTWLPVDEDGDDDPAPLLEELHRLHEAEAAADRPPAASAPEADESLPEDEDADEDFDVDDIEGGDLATRWKNLRKAKRGAHASNE